jgi:metal-dependent HD superfamily phosphatase/phosphodiesterase
MPLECIFDPVGEHGDDRAPDRLEAMLEVERSEARLHESGKDVAVHRQALQLVGVALAAAVLEETLAELQAPADDGAALPRDDVGAELRERPFL